MRPSIRVQGLPVADEYVQTMPMQPVQRARPTKKVETMQQGRTPHVPLRYAKNFHVVNHVYECIAGTQRNAGDDASALMMRYARPGIAPRMKE